MLFHGGISAHVGVVDLDVDAAAADEILQRAGHIHPLISGAVTGTEDTKTRIPAAIGSRIPVGSGVIAVASRVVRAGIGKVQVTTFLNARALVSGAGVPLHFQPLGLVLGRVAAHVGVVHFDVDAVAGDLALHDAGNIHPPVAGAVSRAGNAQAGVTATVVATAHIPVSVAVSVVVSVLIAVTVSTSAAVEAVKINVIAFGEAGVLALPSRYIHHFQPLALALGGITAQVGVVHFHRGLV